MMLNLCAITMIVFADCLNQFNVSNLNKNIISLTPYSFVIIKKNVA